MNNICFTKKLFFLLPILMLSLGCSKHSKNKDINNLAKVITVDLNLNSQKIDLKDISKNISFIQLETNSECLIKWISKIKIHNNRIYVYDSSYMGNLFCFDIQGKFLFKVSERGHGPSEYIFLLDFIIDKENDCLWLGDGARKILKFDLDGNFIERYTTDFSISNLSLLDEKESIMAIRLGYYKDKDYSFVIYSVKDNKILYHKSSDYINIIRSIGLSAFSQSKKGILYTEPFNDTIFNITPKGMEPYYVIDFGKHTFPKNELLENTQLKNITQQLYNPENKYAGLVVDANEVSKYLFFSYRFLGQKQISVYSIETNKTVNINEILFMGKSFEGSTIFPKVQQDNKFISSLPAHLLTEGNASMNEKQIQGFGSYSDITELISNLSEDDNPILIIGELDFDSLFK